MRLYAQDANEMINEGEGEGEGKQKDWIRALTEECSELRENNVKLTAEVRVCVCVCVCGCVVCVCVCVCV